MEVRVALCQFSPSVGNVENNVSRIESCIGSGRADVYVFPEMFLTGYGADCDPLKEECISAISELSSACREYDCAVALGAPRYEGCSVMNSLAFLSPDGDIWYDKTHLARFGVYAENGFGAGGHPAIGRYRGIGFGLCICYDIFFPEILHGCSLNGSSVNICIAASAAESKRYLDRVISARALENVTYLAYVNNIGPMNGLTMHGCSRGLDPFGEEICGCGTEETMSVFVADTDELDRARATRRHLSDFRDDIDWLRPRSV